MGLKENLITDWTNKVITYQGSEMFVVSQFDYEGTNYLYVVDTESIEKDEEEVDVAFLYKVKDDVFANVDDDELFNELLGKVAGELTAEMLKKEFDIK